MNKVHLRHRQSGYIASVDFQETTDGKGQPDWVMLYKPGPKALAEFRAFTKRGGPSTLEIEAPEPSPPLIVPEMTELEQELVQRSVTGAVAAELVRDHAEEKIRAQMERVDWLLEKKPDKVADPAAYLVGAIKNDYAAPKGFVSKAERQRRLEAKQAKEREAEEARRRKQEADSHAKAEQRAVDAYWASLTPEEQATLQAAADAEADPTTRALERGPLKRMGQKIRRDAAILRLLREQGAIPAADTARQDVLEAHRNAGTATPTLP